MVDICQVSNNKIISSPPNGLTIHTNSPHTSSTTQFLLQPIGTSSTLGRVVPSSTLLATTTNNYGGGGSVTNDLVQWLPASNPMQKERTNFVLLVKNPPNNPTPPILEITTPVAASSIPVPPPQPPIVNSPSSSTTNCNSLIKTSSLEDIAPLDLRLKPHDDNLYNNNNLPPPTIHPRANSCSSTTSSHSNCSSLGDEEKRLKRKEQNKVAAQSYRQRKKSFSGLIESEHDFLIKKNNQLKAQKQKLEEQIQRMRELLNEAIEESKREETGAASDTMSEPIRSPVTINIEDDSGVEMMRSRKNTWPLSISSKDRKKEQNKLASRRFRQKRKQEQTECEREEAKLGTMNCQLRKKLQELESKIRLLKDLMNQTNATLNASAVGQTTAKQQTTQ